MNFTVGTKYSKEQDYTQTYSMIPINSTDPLHKEVTQLCDAMEEIGLDTKYSFAICGGSALQLLLSTINEQEVKVVQDLDIKLGYKHSIEKIKNRLSIAEGSVGYVLKFDTSIRTEHLDINSLQFIIQNPARAILNQPLINLANEHNKYTKNFGQSRLATYAYNQPIQYCQPTAYPIANIVQYLHSFDISICQVALVIDNDCYYFIVSDQALIDIANDRISLTKEQEDMFLYSSNKFIRRHLEIVMSRVEKYQQRYNFTLSEGVINAIGRTRPSS